MCGAGCCAVSAAVASRMIAGRSGSVTRFFAAIISSIAFSRALYNGRIASPVICFFFSSRITSR